MLMLEEIKSISQIVRSLTTEAMLCYRKRLLILLQKEEIKAIWENIGGMTEDAIVHELRGQCASDKGTTQVLKDRLLRSRTRMLFGETFSVSWLDKYDSAEVKKVFVIEALGPPFEDTETSSDREYLQAVGEEDDANTTVLASGVESQAGLNRGGAVLTQITSVAWE